MGCKILTRTSLLAMESGFISRHLAGITTITFFKGNIEDVSQTLHRNFQTLLTANPWLAGRLSRDKQSVRVQLVYPESPLPKKIYDELFQINPPPVAIHSRMVYPEIVKAIHHLTVKSPKFILNKKNTFVTKLTLLPDQHDPSRFALLFSMSHSVADGYTYYKILNMLTRTGKTQALNVTRKNQIPPSMIEAVGKKEHGFFTGAAHMLNAVLGLKRSKKNKVSAFYIDTAKINHIKNEVVLEKHTDFISTNDIIFSAFSNFTKARISLMAINFRSKLSGLDDNDAGNYEGVVLYDKDNYETPEKVRNALLTGPPYTGISSQLPGFLTGITCKMSLITNWASLTKDITLAGCETILHLPIINSMPYDAGIIFRPQPGKMGIMIFSKHFNKKECTSNTLSFGNLISHTIFDQT